MTVKSLVQRITPSGRQAVIGIPFLWLFLFFMLPFFIVLKISFAEADVAIPPYTQIYGFVEQKLQIILNLGNYTMLGGRRPVPGGLPRLVEDGLLQHAVVPVDRLPDGLRHCQRAQGTADRAGAADHDADLDRAILIRGLCLDGDPQQ